MRWNPSSFGGLYIVGELHTVGGLHSVGRLHTVAAPEAESSQIITLVT